MLQRENDAHIHMYYTHTQAHTNVHQLKPHYMLVKLSIYVALRYFATSFAIRIEPSTQPSQQVFLLINHSQGWIEGRGSISGSRQACDNH